MKDNQFHISSAKLSGNPSTSGWTQVHEFTPVDEEKLKKRGVLYAIISVSLDITKPPQKESFDAVTSGREILARLHEEYFGKLQTTAFIALKDAVSVVTNEFAEHFSHVEIAAISIKEGVVYSAAGGGAQVSIYRQGMLAKILESKPGSTISASGHSGEDDVLLLTTGPFYQYFTEGVIKASLQEKEVNDAMEAFAPVIHTKEDAFKLGLVLVKFIASASPAAIDKKDREAKRVKKTLLTTAGIKTLLNKGLDRVKTKTPEKRIFVKGVKDQEESPEKKTAVSTGTILIGLLIISIVFGVAQKRKMDYKARFEPQLSQAKHEYEEAINLFSLNPERSRELFVSSRSIVENLLAQDYEDEELIRLKQDVDANLGRILGEYEVSPTLFLDLSLISNGFSGKAMVSSEGVLYVLGSEGKRMVEVDIASKRTEVVAGPDDLDGIDKFTAYSERVFVVDEHIYEVDDGLTKVIGKDWDDNFNFFAYAGNIYVLDKDESEVYRFAGTGESFGSKGKWLAPGIDINLSGVTDWTIDGSIWFLFETGKILKLTHGSPQKFEIRGVNPHFSRPSFIYTNEELESVYVLEQDRGRIVVLGKEGQYKAQYSSETIKAATSMVVSEKEGKIILLVGDRLQEIQIKH